MNQGIYRFWTCPECIYVRDLNLEEMTNRCRRIDEGESPVDGTAWEYKDRDVCPGFEPILEIVGVRR